MSGFVHSCELKGLWLLAQRLTNVSLYKYREFDKRNRIDKPCLCCCSTLNIRLFKECILLVYI
jgi:hypothetical protein